MHMSDSITTTGFILPAFLGHQVGLYADRCSQGFGTAQGPWTDAEGRANTFGIDFATLRLRLVSERLDGRRAAAAGLF